MKAVMLTLEDFGDAARSRKSAAERTRETELAEARGAGHAAGYAEGFAAAAEKAATEERAALADLLETARDLDLARAAAASHAIAALGPVVAALARVAAPRAAALGLAEELAVAVAARLEAEPSTRLEARVAPSVLESVSARLGDDLPVSADATLGPTEARLDWPGGGLRFDAEAAVAAALQAIERHFQLHDTEGLKDVG